VKFKLPWTLRTGVEARVGEGTRVEASFVYEAWSMQQTIDLVPNGISLQNVALFPPSYAVGPISLQRGFKDAWSLRLGGEQSVALGSYKLDARAGFSYETSAIPKAYLSPLTMDSNKFTVSLGAGFHVSRALRLDAMGALLLPQAVDVSPSEAAISAVNPVRANNPPGGSPAINGGHYQWSALLLGLGLRYQFGVKADGGA
jgi:long-chain fatty acid transport protein